jgi:hypothetical protein
MLAACEHTADEHRAYEGEARDPRAEAATYQEHDMEAVNWYFF